MQSTTKFIIKPLNDSRFINTKEFEGKSLTINTSIEDHRDSNRIGVVVSVPATYKGTIRKGDQVVVNHNVFRMYYDGSGVNRESDWHVKDNLFSVGLDLIYMAIRDGKRMSVDTHVFVEPIREVKKWIGEVEVEHTGIIKYLNDDMLKLGIKEGDKIAFGRDSEYAFEIFGEQLYLMRNARILAKIED